jgi:hypothetical protein
MSEASGFDSENKRSSRVLHNKSFSQMLWSSPPSKFFRFILTTTICSVVVFCFVHTSLNTVLSHSISYSNATLGAASSLVIADSSLRATFQLYSERYNILHNMFLTSDLEGSLTPEDKNFVETQVNIMNENIYRFFAGDKIFLTLKVEAATAYQMLTRSLTSISLQEKSSLVSRGMHDNLRINTYDDATSEVLTTSMYSPLTFLRSFAAGLKTFYEILSLLQPILDAQAPPYVIPPELISEILSKQKTQRFTTVRNIFDGVLSFFSNSFNKLKVIATETTPNTTRLFFAIYLIASGFIILIYTVVGVVAGKRLNRSLFEALSLYNELKTEEISVHKETYYKRLKFLETYKLHEPKMISGCIVGSSLHHESNVKLKNLTNIQKRATRKKRSSIKVNSVGSSVVNEFSKSTRSLYSPSKSKLQRLRYNITFRIVKYLVWSTITKLLLFIGLLFFYFDIYSKTQEVALRLDHFFDFYSHLTAVSNNYYYHSLYTMYGNAIRIDGQFASDLIEKSREENPIRDLIAEGMDSRHLILRLYGPDHSKDVERMWFTDLCWLFEAEPDKYPLCKYYLPSSKGLISLLSAERDFLDEIHGLVRANPTFSETSKSRYFISPFNDFIYAAPNLLLRLLHRICFEKIPKFIAKLSQEGIVFQIDSLDDILSRLAGKIMTVVFLAIIFVDLLIAWTISKRDSAACTETLRSLLPHTLFQNKLLLARTKQLFPLAFPI